MTGRNARAVMPDHHFDPTAKRRRRLVPVALHAPAGEGGRWAARVTEDGQ